MQNTIPKRIVITGGPGTGKTSLVAALEKSGHPCFEELIRSMTLAAKNRGSKKEIVSNPLAFVDDPYRFNQELLKGRLEQFLQAVHMNGNRVFYDRGMPDVLAYMNYFGQSYGADFKNTCLMHRYDHVLLLPPWQDIYVQDNERLENFEEAIEIHDTLERAYKDLGYEPIEVPTGAVQDRLRFVDNLFN